MSTISQEDPDIQWGYAGTARAPGMIVDYINSIFDGITIVNIESN